MKVGLLVPGWARDDRDPGLAAVSDVVEELGQTAHVRIIALRYPSPARSYEWRGIPVMSVGGGEVDGVGRIPYMARALRQVVEAHRREPFDVLHGMWLDEPGTIAVLAGRALGVPAVASLMGGELVNLQDIAYGGQRSAINRVLTSAVLRYAPAVTAAMLLSAPTGRQFENLVWGVEPSRFGRHGPMAALAGKFRLLQVGSLVPVKDHVLSLEALAAFRSAGIDAHLHSVGEGPRRGALARHAIALGVGTAVTFHGHVPRDCLAPYYRGAHVLLITSRHETQPTVALEAALCGLPIAATAVGLPGAWSPEAALTSAPRDVAGLARNLERLHDPAVRTGIAAAAETLVRTYGLAAQTAGQLLGMYQRLHAERNDRAYTSITAHRVRLL